MNNAYINGFVANAKKSGLSEKVAIQLLSKVADAHGQMFQDPSALAGGAAGAPPDPTGGAGGPPPMPAGDPSAQAPQVPSTGVPPEIEQLIQQLPPEVLQQLLAEIQAEVANGPQGAGQDPNAGAGGPPPQDPNAGAGAPPQDPNAGIPKQGAQTLIAKEASYVEGFYERATAYGFDKNATEAIYKKAVDIMSNTPAVVKPALADKVASSSHYEGFLLQARNSGLNEKEAADIYSRYFNN